MMKLQKFILCVAVALAAFGASLGLIELGNYVRTAFLAPKSSAEIKPARPIPAPTVIVPPNAEFRLSTVLPASEPAEEPEYEWSETGDYYIAGKNPKDFKEFDSLSIVTREWNDEKRRLVAVKPSGGVYTSSESDSQEYKFSAININGKRISIVTRERNGISYQFDGKFVDEKIKHTNADGYEYEADILLKGRLTKWRNGKKIAEAKVNLEMGGC